MNTKVDFLNNLRNLFQDHMLESSSIGICITNPNEIGNPIVYCNSAFSRISGYSKDEVLGRNCRFLQGIETDPTSLEKISIGLKQQCDIKVIVKNYRKNKTLFWNELQISPIKDSEGNLLFFIGFQNDVTDRVLLEESLKSAQNRQLNFFEASGDFFWELNPKGVITFFSNKISELTGFLPNEYYGNNLCDYLNDENIESQKLQISELLSQQKSFRNVKLNLKTKNEKNIWIRLNGKPQFDIVTHQFVGLIGSGADITAEQSQLFETQRLSTLGEIAAEIAHEIVNPLSIINGQVSLIDKYLKTISTENSSEDFNKIYASLFKIRQMVNRTHKIISGAKALAKNGTDDAFETISIEELIEEAFEFCQSKIRLANAKTELTQKTFSTQFYYKPIQISQAIINLIYNACEYLIKENLSNNDNWIRIETENIDQDLILRISNSGQNSAANINNAIHNPYLSTKTGKSGTGIGLQLVKKVMKQHNGSIEIDPETSYKSIILRFPQIVQSDLKEAS